VIRKQEHCPKPLAAATVLLMLLLSLALMVPAAAWADEDMQQMDQFLALMKSYLGVSDQWVEMNSQRETVIFLAIEGIVEIYEQRGERAKAIPHLRKILDKNRDNQTVRNAVHFKLRDLYKETGRTQEALDELDRVVDENSR